MLGRLLADEDEQSLVLSYGLFQRRFGGLPAVIGQALEISGAPFTIVGVLPETFRVTFPQQTAPGDELRDIDAFISLPRGQQLPGTAIKSPNRPAPPWIRVVARLAPAIPVSRARLEMQTLHARLQRDYPRPPALLRSIRVVPLQDKLTESARFSLLVLQGAVGFVLLIAVANVANLLLAQASLRTRETAIRAALGAGRGRLILQFLVESVVLALIAGTTGVVVAYAAVPLLVSLAPFSVTGIADIAVDGPVLAFTLFISILTAVLFAWAPVFETSRVSLLSTLGGTTPTATAGSVTNAGPADQSRGRTGRAAPHGGWPDGQEPLATAVVPRRVYASGHIHHARPAFRAPLRGSRPEARVRQRVAAASREHSGRRSGRHRQRHLQHARGGERCRPRRP